MIRGTSKRRARTKQSRKDGKEKKKSSQVSCTKDMTSFLKVACNEPPFGLKNGSSLPEVFVPSPDDAALPKSSLCSFHTQGNKGMPELCVAQPKEQSKENLPCNNVVLSPPSHSPHVIKASDTESIYFTLYPHSSSFRYGSRKTGEDGKSQHLLTEYFPVRRSNRKTLRDVQKEKQKVVEEAIISGKEDGFEVKEFPGKGRGVITKKNLKRGDFVLEYYGELIDMEEAKKREEMYAAKESTGCYMYYFKHEAKQYCIDATKESGRLGRLVNHSKKGNLKTQPFFIKDSPHLILVACRDIVPGEELLYDYGDRSKKSLESYPWLAL